VSQGNARLEEFKKRLPFVLKALKRGELEQLLATNLAAAVFARPLDKIRMILEAFMLLSEEEQQKVAGDKLELFKKMYEVVISLANTVVVRGDRFVEVEVPWAFGVNKAEEYLAPFLTIVWPLEAHDKREYYEKLYVELRATNDVGFVESAKSNFVVNAMPHALWLLRRMFEEFVSREAWEGTLSILRGRREGRGLTSWT